MRARFRPCTRPWTATSSSRSPPASGPATWTSASSARWRRKRWPTRLPAPRGRRPALRAFRPFATSRNSARPPMANTRTHRIAVIAGDGIGKEVIPAGLAAIEAATRGTGVALALTDLPWSCDYYTRHGRMMDADGFERLATFDAIYLGAIGSPSVADHIAVWDLLLPLRQRFQQYVNLRPMRLLAGLASPLANRSAADIDMVCVRENSEGEYAGLGGRVHVGTPHEVAEQ